MSSDDLQGMLSRLGACGDERQWATDRSPDLKAWCECKRGDWLLWLAGRLGVDEKLVVLAGAKCARQVLRFIPRTERRPLRAVQAKEKWARGKISRKEMNVVIAAAWDAYWAMTNEPALAGTPRTATWAVTAPASSSSASIAARIVRRTAPQPQGDRAYYASLAESARRVRKVIPYRVIKAAWDKYFAETKKAA